MKKMTKGAIVTGLGVALLLGGGGTLAVWNTSQTANAGEIVAGDLDLTASTAVWTSNLVSRTEDNRNGEIDIASHKIIPGETLTYTQDLTVTLVGDELEATLTALGATSANGFGDNVTVSAPVLSTGTNVLTQDNDGDTVTATTTFEFLEATSGREDNNAVYDFGDYSYVLTQKAPSES